MGQLRDFFAAIGLCESTEDLAKKPELINQLVKRALYFADIQNEYEQACSYEERLRLVLSQGTSYSLSRLLEENVIVCMDRRLSHLDEGFWDDDIYAVFYNRNDKRVLAFYDNGDTDPRFLSYSIIDYVDDVINELVYDYLDHGEAPTMLLGHTYYSAATKTTQFEWETQDYFSSELSRNPELFEPPLKKGPVNAPDLTMKY